MDPEELITYCGLYGGQCARWRGFPYVREMAAELLELLDAMRCDEWMPSAVTEFNYDDFREGLKFLGQSDNGFTCRRCCRGDDGYPGCPVRICAREKQVESCFECGEFPCSTCRPFFGIEKRAEEYNQLGRKHWLQYQKKLAERGYELHTGKCYCHAVMKATPHAKG